MIDIRIYVIASEDDKSARFRSLINKWTFT